MDSKWHFDLWSALIGMAIGLVSALVGSRLRQPAATRWGILREKLHAMRHWLSSGIEARYRSELVNFCQDYHLGVGAARLQDIYVPVRFLAPLPEPTPDADMILPKSQLPYLWPELAALVAIEPPPTLTLSELVTSTRRGLLLAPAGAGKSTVLAYLALAAAQPELVPELSFPPASLPILVHLAELVLPPHTLEEEPPIDEPLLNALRNRAGSLTADALPAALRRALTEGNAIILLDGWDDLTPAERRPYTRWFTRFVSQYPDNQYLLSAPLDGYGPLLDLDFVPFTLTDWDPNQVTQLAQRWANVLDATLPTVRASQRPGSEQIPALDFWQAGMSPFDITLNLWLMLIDQEPATQRVSRFGTGIHHLLAPFGNGENNWPLEIAHQVLGQLAGLMDRDDTRTASLVQLNDIITEVLQQHEDTDEQTIRQCRQILGRASGLLIPWRDDSLAFQSPLLFDYFWAYQLVATQNVTPIRPRLGDPAWSNAVALFAEMTDPAPLIDAMIKRPPGLFADNLFWAAQWAATMKEQAERKRAILIRLAQLLINPQTPQALRERAAAALVGTRDPGVGYLLRQALASPDPVLRATAVPGLGALATDLPGRPGDQKSFQLLLRALEDETELVQMAVIHALAATRSEQATEPLIRVLLQAAPNTRQVAAEALARTGLEGHQILREALDEEDVLVRRAALAGLALVDAPWVDEKLDHLKRHDEEWLVRSAAQELEDRRQQSQHDRVFAPPQPENLAWLVSWAASKGAGVPAGPAATAMLERVLQEADEEEVRAAAARSLGDIGNPNFVGPLTSAVRDSAPLVREAAIFSLAAIGRARSQAVSPN